MSRVLGLCEPTILPSIRFECRPLMAISPLHFYHCSFEQPFPKQKVHWKRFFRLNLSRLNCFPVTLPSVSTIPAPVPTAAKDILLATPEKSSLTSIERTFWDNPGEVAILCSYSLCFFGLIWRRDIARVIKEWWFYAHHSLQIMRLLT